MKLTLDRPPQAYNANDQANLRQRLEGAFRGLFARDQDNYLGRGRLILTDEDDGSLQEVYVASGVLSVRPV